MTRRSAPGSIRFRTRRRGSRSSRARSTWSPGPGCSPRRTGSRSIRGGASTWLRHPSRSAGSIGATEASRSSFGSRALAASGSRSRGLALKAGKPYLEHPDVPISGGAARATRNEPEYLPPALARNTTGVPQTGRMLVQTPLGTEDVPCAMRGAGPQNLRSARREVRCFPTLPVTERRPTRRMTVITETAVLDALRNVQEPELGRDIVTLDMVKSIAIDEARIAFTIELTTPACPLKDEIEGNARMVLTDLGASQVDITWGAMVRRAQPRQAEQLVPGVKNIIAVASGKGGVGKSTVSVNLAVALAQAGASVGLLDADITGPNIPQMLGVEGQPKASPNNKITPLERHGVKTISIQFFVPEGQPIVWRG